MTDSDHSPIDLNPPALKPVADAPWSDDALQRRGIASELDRLVSDLAGGAEPATIALDGGYGTGKTFILERWVQEMHDRGQVAVYYNAWENDCDDDPLVSLIETLASNDKTDWGKRLAPALNEVLTGVLRTYTGIDAQKTWKAGKDQPVGLLEAAKSRRESREKLKDILAELVDAAGDNEFPGVVVVVDELDRCRPIFANELMERVKHVLNVPGLVFVFGVNIVALRETVRAVYGNIDTHQYLLRMFITTLHMPPGVAFPGTDPGQKTAAYLHGLADRHGLQSFCDRHALLKKSLGEALHLLGLVAGGGRITPRELERIMWLLSKVAAASLSPDGQVSAMLPNVLLPLAIASVKDPDAYHQTVSHPDQAPAVINCLFELINEANLDKYHLRPLDRLEMTMYRVCHQRYPSEGTSLPPAYVTLDEFVREDGASTLKNQHLSRRSAGITKERAKTLLDAAPPELELVGVRGVDVHVTWTFGTLRFITSRFDVVWPKSRAR